MALEMDMLDNYIKAAFAAVRLNLPRDLPMIVWNAKNRSLYQGLHGEISVLRTLLWAGFSPNSVDANGNTGLHYFCRLKYMPVANARAIRMLLASGCDPNIQNKNGDTALHVLAGNSVWTKGCTKAYKTLIQNKANVKLTARDGETFRTLMEANQVSSPSQERAAVIATI